MNLGISLFNNLKNLSNNGNLPINNFKCINNESEIEGIYTDKNFSFYKIKVESNKIDEINDLLKTNECNLQFYYKDYILDIDNNKKPIQPILNSLFIQINPNFNIKKNVFFMKYNFKNEDKLIDIPYLTSSEEEKTVVGFSRTEDYFIYKQDDSSDSNDMVKYATLYLRVDIRKTEIVRKYQNFLDFYAENTSFWFGIFEFLNIFFTLYNGFHANLSMSKKLFFFGKINDDNKYNILRKDSLKSNNSNTILRKGTINSINNTNKEISNFKEDKKNISVIYSKKEMAYNNYINPIEKPLNSEEETTNISKKSTIQIDENNNKNNTISLFEVIKISIFTCCECCEKNIKHKEKRIQKAMDIFNKKLDIYIYTKNMILIDIMYQILMDDINKDYVNFLSRSLNYLNKNNEKESEELEEIYKPTTKLNSDYSDKLYNEFMDLMEKKKKMKLKKKLFLFIKIKIKDSFNK